MVDTDLTVTGTLMALIVRTKEEAIVTGLTAGRRVTDLAVSVAGIALAIESIFIVKYAINALRALRS